MLINTKAEAEAKAEIEIEKTKEQKLASKQRYLAQESNAIEMLHTDSLYDYISGLKYNYSLCIRYNINLKKTIDKNVNEVNKPSFDKCVKCGILKDWNNTYWFDKEKAERLQQYILEHQN